jgi:DNA-binding FrmR family transcriptional regulator
MSNPNLLQDIMADEAIFKEVILKRLRRVEGQIRGIQKMIESQRECESVITQLAAVRSAIEGVGGLILSNYMKICFRDEKAPESVDVESLARAIAIWGNVHLNDTDSREATVEDTSQPIAYHTCVAGGIENLPTPVSLSSVKPSTFMG